jgi:hypothetical protein
MAMKPNFQQFEIIDGKAEAVFPCRCGATHRGEYALHDWMHHNCFHGPLYYVPGEDEAMCSSCGEVFAMHIEQESEHS